MTDSSDVVTEEKSPVADAVEPLMNFREPLFIEVQIFSEFVNDADAEGPADGIAEADAAPASRQSENPGDDWIHLAFEDEVAAEDQESFVRNGDADDAQHQQNKNRGVSVGADPLDMKKSIATTIAKRKC